jgi:hypothetical protein
MRNETVAQALASWKAGRATLAGWLLYEQIPISLRPLWAARILDASRGVTPWPPEVEAVYEMARDPPEWAKGHAAFRAVRRLTLQYDKDDPYGCLLRLAENVAKVTYNATGPRDPFDYGAGSWVVSCLRGLVDRVNSPEFEARSWSAASQIS